MNNTIVYPILSTAMHLTTLLYVAVPLLFVTVTPDPLKASNVIFATIMGLTTIVFDLCVHIYHVRDFHPDDVDVNEVKAWLELRYYKHVVDGSILYCSSNEKLEHRYQYNKRGLCKWQISVFTGYTLYNRNFRKITPGDNDIITGRNIKTEEEVYYIIWQEEMKNHG